MKGEKAAARAMVKAAFAVTLVCLVLFGSIGVLDYAGTTGLFDHSALILFDALLMTAGFAPWSAKTSSVRRQWARC